MTGYLTVAEVLAMHADQIERYGGSQGVRDQGLLEAALYRPQTGYYAGLIEEAAALWESLAQNHPFIDGNKRTAFAATYTFLATTVRVSRRTPRRSTFLSPPSTKATSSASTILSHGCAVR
jgi:death-on-curing family protein